MLEKSTPGSAEVRCFKTMRTADGKETYPGLRHRTLCSESMEVEQVLQPTTLSAPHQHSGLLCLCLLICASSGGRHAVRKLQHVSHRPRRPASAAAGGSRQGAGHGYCIRQKLEHSSFSRRFGWIGVRKLVPFDFSRDSASIGVFAFPKEQEPKKWSTYTTLIFFAVQLVYTR